MINLLFYEYVPITNPKTFQKQQLRLCRKLGILGRLLIAQEGINGNITGSRIAIQAYKRTLKRDPRFEHIHWKEGVANEHNFKKLTIRLPKELVTSRFGNKAPKQKKGQYITPKQLKKALDAKEDIILLDMRNDYECNLGKFNNSISLPIENFRDLPKHVSKLRKYKNKSIVTYCTGGVRCEKGSAFLKYKGFKNVKQLRGGILNYGKHCSTAHWQGKCFVFDNRGAIDIDPKKQSQPITQCILCHTPESTYYDCRNVDCDKYFTACQKCHDILEECCSKHCRNRFVGKKVTAPAIPL